MLPVSKRIVQALSMPIRPWMAVISACLLAMAGCETTPPVPPVDVNALQQEAERLFAEKELEQALQAYNQLVGASGGSDRSNYLIAGAEILLLLGAYDSADEWLTRAGADATPDQVQRTADLRQRILAARTPAAVPLTQVALLLPLTGPQRQAAVAIQDGFLAAHLSQPRPGGRDRPAVHLYDTGLVDVREAYRRARDDGAQFIVGPLLKPALEAIADSVGPTPTLALNTLEGGRSLANLYQFALAPEDEASQVARYAMANGAIHAVALVPRNDWGNRLLGSFRSQLESLGGKLLQVRTYEPTDQDFSVSITQVLNIDRSDQRRQRLSADLGIALEFESRRRQDIDVIFLAADAGAGRLLAPQLRFYFAGDIPTYATSAIYESSRQNADLNGLMFTDTPWVLLDEAAPALLAATLRRYWPQRSAAQWTRFYGLGHDAYRLISVLHEQPGSLESFSALSGELSLDETGRIRRELPLAQFRGGQPVTVDLEAGASPESTAAIAVSR